MVIRCWRAELGCSPRHMKGLPDFDNPPLVEVALGIQFRPFMHLRGLELAPLRERWREAYPHVEEQPALPSAIEGAAAGQIALQVNLGPVAPTRFTFVSADGSEVAQVQHDRL